MHKTLLTSRLTCFNNQTSNVFPAIDKHALRASWAMWRSLCGGRATLWNISIPALKLLIASTTFSTWQKNENNFFSCIQKVKVLTSIKTAPCSNKSSASWTKLIDSCSDPLCLHIRHLTSFAPEFKRSCGNMKNPPQPSVGQRNRHLLFSLSWTGQFSRHAWHSHLNQ